MEGEAVIVSHAPPYHLDDYLAVSLLLHKYPGAKHVTVRRPNDLEKVIEENMDKLVIVVDVGRRYEVGDRLRFYDHHQDRGLPSSLHLVLKHEFPELYQAFQRIPQLRTLLEYIDVRDTRGPVEVARRFGLDPQNPLLVTLQRLPGLFMTEPSARVGENLENIAKTYIAVAENVKVIEVNGVKVAVTTADPRKVSASAIFDVTGADLLIAPNARDPSKAQVTKNINSPRYGEIDLSRLKLPTVFRHPSGFMAVLDLPPEEAARHAREIARQVAPSRRQRAAVEAS